jgi:hypothetical protein
MSTSRHLDALTSMLFCDYYNIHPCSCPPLPNTHTIQIDPTPIGSVIVQWFRPVGEAAETGEGAGTEADGGEVALAAFVSPSFFSPVVLSECGSATVGFSLSE